VCHKSITARDSDRVRSASAWTSYNEIHADRLVFLDASAGQYFSLDGVGSRFWRLFQDGHDVTQCIEVLLNEYDVEREVLQADIEGLTQKMKARGILIETSSSNTV